METESSEEHAALRARLAAALGDGYVLERELGGGGMSRVFLVEDVRLGRRVVVKLLHPDLAAGVSVRRFEREVRLAARLQHPHVLPLLSAGEIEGLPYFTMPFVEGESLRHRLARGGALPMPEALRLVRELAYALAYAHAQGVVHRDLKPENVLLSGGHAVVADFGVAKALSAAAQGSGGQAAGGATLGGTGLGVAVGTPGYMAPEQAAADPATDHRADLYALGIIAYEVLAGAHPFAGREPQALLAAQLTETPPPVTAARPDAPPAITALVARLLAKRPDGRPASADDVVRTLDEVAATPHPAAAARAPRRRPGVRRLAAAGLGVALVAVAAAAFAWGRRPTAPTPGARAASPAPAAPAAPAGSPLVEQRVAVVPFENLTGDSALASFGRFASDWVTQGLAEAGFAEVVDPQTVRFAWQTAANPRALGAATGARYVVSGTYHLDGDSLRLIGRVTDAADGRLLSAIDPVTVPARGQREAVAALRERVVGAVGGLVDRRLAGANTIASGGLPPSAAAYRHWSAGMDYFNRNDFRRATGELEAAARLDSTFVGPLLYAAVAHTALGESAEADSLLRIADRSRARLAPGDRYLLDAWLAENRGDWAGALSAIREARRLAPGNISTLAVTWWNALRTNRPREALAALARLDPERPPIWHYPPYWEVTTRAHHQLGDHAAELAAAVRGLQLHPNHVPIVYAEARALAALGRVAEAERRIGELLELPRDPQYSPGELAWGLGRELRAHGHEAAALAVFGRALAWYDARPAADRAAPRTRGRRAETLYALGRWDEARLQFAALAAERRGEATRVGDAGALGIAALGAVDYRGYLGALAARRGDRAAALAADGVLAAWRGPHLLGRNTLWRARIAALLSDRERAVALLRDALRQGRTHLVLHAEADLASLHDLPAFQEIVRPKG